MRMHTSILVSALLAGSALAQQNIVYYPTPTPAGGNAFPFGSEGIRYQSIIPQSTIGKAVAMINDIYAFGRGTDLVVVYEDIEIRLGITTVAPGGLTSNWTTNNPSPTTVYRGPLRINFESGKWTGIGLPNPYLFLATGPNDNLCFEVIVWSAKTMVSTTSSNFYYPGADGATQRAFLYRWTSSQASGASTGNAACTLGLLLDNGNFVVAGKGCTSSANTDLVIQGSTYPQPGKDLTVSLSGGAPTTVSFLALGGPFTPFDMTPIGAPMCHVWFTPLISVGAVTDPAGATGFKATIPASATSGTIYAQWYQLDPNANYLGLTTSNYATVIFGN